MGSAVATFQEICQIAVEDGIAFDPASVKGTEIRKEAGYAGVRIDLQARLDGARIVLQVDIGFGDAVTPAPESISYPVMLGDLWIEAIFLQKRCPLRLPGSISREGIAQANRD